VALDELSVAEAAAALQISTVAARVRLHRARRRLAAPDSRGLAKLEVLRTEPQP